LNHAEIIKKLKSMRNQENIDGMARFGIIGKEVLGIQIYKLRNLARTIGRNHELALKLYDTGIHEVMMLASFIEDPAKVTMEQLNSWALRFESWDHVDMTAHLFSKTKLADQIISEWVNREEELVKRMPFVIICHYAVHRKELPDKAFRKYFELIKKHSTDERNYVKKAVNWALRSIGKRNIKLNREAIKVAEELKKSSDKTARWIGSHALRELTSDKVQKRLSKKL